MRYIIGLGNYLMFDDSIGIRIIEEIWEKKLERDFKAVDLSNNLLDIVSFLNKATERILFVDSMRGEKSGSVISFLLEEVETVKHEGNLSTHEGDILKVLHMAKNMKYPIPKIEFMGIVPFEIKQEIGISESLRSNLSSYVKTAIETILK